MSKWKEWEINKIEKSDDGWPEQLRQIKPKVDKLYYRGSWDKEIFSKCLAVVGTRKMTRYGEESVEKILPAVVQAGMTIVSGFMYGIDTKGHKVCLDYGGRTIAVLGSGLNEPTPASNDQLYTDILESGGLIVSEYEPNQKSRRWMFPQRNRIVAGLSQAVLVIEGGEKSGTLITAKLGKKQGKPVLAVPGPIGSSMARASNGLIKEGAVLIENGDEVLEVLGIDKIKQREMAIEKKLGGLEKKIVKALKRETLEIDELGRKLKIEVSELANKLSELQLRGIVQERLGRYSIK